MMSMLKFKLMLKLLLMLIYFVTQDGSRSEQEARRHQNTIRILVNLSLFRVNGISIKGVSHELSVQI